MLLTQEVVEYFTLCHLVATLSQGLCWTLSVAASVSLLITSTSLMAFAEYNLFGLFINSAGNILSAHSFGKLHLLASCFCLAVVYVLLKAICSGFMQVRTALPWEHRSPKTDIQLQCSWTLTRRENRAEKLVLSEFNNKKKKKAEQIMVMRIFLLATEGFGVRDLLRSRWSFPFSH